jgi:hypothetical protein
VLVHIRLIRNQLVPVFRIRIVGEKAIRFVTCAGAVICSLSVRRYVLRPRDSSNSINSRYASLNPHGRLPVALTAICRNVSELFVVSGVTLAQSQGCPAPLRRLRLRPGQAGNFAFVPDLVGSD